MPVYDRSMPAGIAGNITRRAASVTEPVLLAAETAIGAALAINAEGEAGAAVTAATVKGFLVRIYPTQSAANGFGGGTMAAKGVQDSLRSGWISVQLSAAETATGHKGTPLKLVEVAANGFAVGDLAISEGVAIPGAALTGPADASGIVEIEFNI